MTDAPAPTLPTLTVFEERALALLVEQTRLVGPGWFGSELWPDTRRTTSAFARPAGRVLNRLRKLGLAEYTAEGPDRRSQWGWRATPAGRRRATAVPSPDTRGGS